MSITDKVRYKRITDNVRYTRNTDFVYNGQKTLVPTGTLYARFTVYNILRQKQKVNSSSKEIKSVSQRRESIIF